MKMAIQIQRRKRTVRRKKTKSMDSQVIKNPKSVSPVFNLINHLKRSISLHPSEEEMLTDLLRSRGKETGRNHRLDLPNMPLHVPQLHRLAFLDAPGFINLMWLRLQYRSMLSTPWKHFYLVQLSVLVWYYYSSIPNWQTPFPTNDCSWRTKENGNSYIQLTLSCEFCFFMIYFLSLCTYKDPNLV